ncbi:T9SS type A sorting domain-containing protein [Aquimarina agarilytica]|uniref:T9SS type A sorting domain-containing protein n=1 Tax=Aquimarina agarilytica TaxID=1087449 RepID=UPI00028837AA|nr:T9SS type A sorting domain-containing protein [Aquimarina agarilytica]
MTLKKMLSLLLLFGIISSLKATDYYIDAKNGNDSNNGLAVSSAFKSLYKIDALSLQPGDNVYFLEGHYTRPNATLITITQSGNEDEYITFQNYNNQDVLLEFDSWTGIDIINGASYLKFIGLKIKGARSKIDLDDALNQPGSCANDFVGGANGFYNGTGILAVGPNLLWSNPATTGNEIPHHISIENCEVFDCTSSGMAFQQADYITIKNNKVYNNCWYSIYGTSGINLYQFINTDNTTGFHNDISNNLMYGNEMRVPQVPFCEFFDGNAFIIDDFKHTQTKNYLDKSVIFDDYTAKTLISNNISVENGGSGLHFFLSSNCYIYNNTIVNNASQNNGKNGNGDLRIGACNNFEIKNNIIIGQDRLHNIGGNSNIVYTHNLHYGPGILSTLTACENCIENTPLEFINTDVSDQIPFVTNFESSVKNAGVALTEITTDFFGTTRPQNDTHDIGAYELLACYPTLWFADNDTDGLGDANETLSACDQPIDYVASKGDQCPEDANKIAPGACGCGNAEDSCDTLCSSPEYNADTTYANTGTVILYMGKAYESKWYTKGDTPTNGGPWRLVGICNGETLDCTTINDWSANTIYTTPGTQITFEHRIYENKWHVTGQTPDTSDAWELTGICDTINMLPEASILITPSLVSDVISIETSTAYTLNILDLSGVLISSHIITAGTNTIDTTHLLSGMHVLLFTNNQSSITERIIKL